MKSSIRVRPESEHKGSHRDGLLLAGGGMLLISLDALGIRLSGASAWDAAFWLGTFTALAMVVLVPVRTGKSLVAAAREGRAPIIASSVLQAGTLSFFVLAVTLTSVANTVIIIAAAPVFAALMAYAAIGERTTNRTWVAIVLSSVGICTVVLGSIGSGRIEGDLFAVAAILCFATNLTLWRRIPKLDRLVVVGIGGAITALIALVPAQPMQLGPRALVLLAILGSLTGPAGRVAVASATRYLSAAQVGLFAPTETVAAIGWAWLFLDEIPSPATLVGGLIVIAAVLFGVVSPPTKASPVPRL